MFKRGTLLFWWRNTHGNYNVLVPDVQTALALYSYNVERDLQDSSVQMNYGGLEEWEDFGEGFGWSEWSNDDGYSLSDLFDQNQDDLEDFDRGAE